MNYAIILCLCALIIIMLAMTFSRSQSLQRFGVIEFSLVLAVGGSALFGYMQAQQLTTDQYFQLFSVHFGGAYAYINELEQCDEYDDSAKKQKLGELEKLLNDILPVTYTEDESYRYVNAVVLERDETDNYRQCWFSGENTMFWQDVSERATPFSFCSASRTRFVSSRSFCPNKWYNAAVKRAPIGSSQIKKGFSILVSVT